MAADTTGKQSPGKLGAMSERTSAMLRQMGRQPVGWPGGWDGARPSPAAPRPWASSLSRSLAFVCCRHGWDGSDGVMRWNAMRGRACGAGGRTGCDNAAAVMKGASERASPARVECTVIHYVPKALARQIAVVIQACKLRLERSGGCYGQTNSPASSTQLFCTPSRTKDAGEPDAACVACWQARAGPGQATPSRKRESEQRAEARRGAAERSKGRSSGRSRAERGAPVPKQIVH
ncbi:hypothetical protein AXG93_1163s1200 [Marchantia polymorpha subsp. ruderalis]|uniref:Uncharacterized protein n=1 Tax=Marchantia polymorpha subsp. ruderalis TaxID=1480154 RepID=A0A176VY57_MARPO|nr:hypothetical protein AXG93_1163s1200 [Marchantia polymorpha subsp. ruderalis]